MKSGNPIRPGLSRGFSLIELMVSMAIIGIATAIAIPTLVNAIDRGRQKRTMSDLRSIGTALAAYSVDNNNYPAGNSIGDLAPSLETQYMKKLVTRDAWGHDLVFSRPDPLSYTLGSAGKDGGAALNLIGTGGPTHEFGDDIIHVNGVFVQWPQGLQTD